MRAMTIKMNTAPDKGDAVPWVKCLLPRMIDSVPRRRT